MLRVHFFYLFCFLLKVLGVCLFLFFLSFVFLSFQGLKSLFFSLFLFFFSRSRKPNILISFSFFLRSRELYSFSSFSSWSYFFNSFSFFLFKVLRVSFHLSFFPVHDIYSLQFYVLSQEYTKNTHTFFICYVRFLLLLCLFCLRL